MQFAEPHGALRLGGGQIPGLLLVLKSSRTMRAVAKRLIGRMAATAKGHCRPAPKPVGFSFHVHKLNLAFHTQRAVIANRNLCSRHGESLLRMIFTIEGADFF